MPEARARSFRNRTQGGSPLACKQMHEHNVSGPEATRERRSLEMETEVAVSVLGQPGTGGPGRGGT